MSDDLDPRVRDEQDALAPRQGDERRPGELTALELARWTWRQLTSMRTALVLLLLLALAAVPGSVIPQEGVDSLKTSRWQDAHPELTPIYEKLGLFSVYDSPWFAAIYLLLMISLVGCIIPRLFVYWRAMRAEPPRAPRNLTRLRDHTSYDASEQPAELLDRAAEALRRRGYRVRRREDGQDAISAEKGYLREAGNLLFHLSLLIVLVGFAMGGLFGYKGGVIMVVGNGFSNSLTQYDDFDPGSLFDPDDMEPFTLNVKNFDAQWLVSGQGAGMARKFAADVEYTETPGGEKKDFDLKVNKPLQIGDTEVFLIGHGYAPVITVRDGQGNVAYSGPTIFLPEDGTFKSFGVVKAPDALPTQIGLEGEFYPTYSFTMQRGPFSSFGDLLNPAISMLVYTGNLGMDDGDPQSVYALDKSRAQVLKKDDGSMFRVDLQPGERTRLPNGAGSVSFDGIERWNKIQVSRTPGKEIALAGVSLALLGLLGSLFIRPRRAWVRVRPGDGSGNESGNGSGDASGARVEVAVLDRSGGGDSAAEVTAIVEKLGGNQPSDTEERT